MRWMWVGLLGLLSFSAHAADTVVASAHSPMALSIVESLGDYDDPVSVLHLEAAPPATPRVALGLFQDPSEQTFWALVARRGDQPWRVVFQMPQGPMECHRQAALFQTLRVHLKTFRMGEVLIPEALKSDMTIADRLARQNPQHTCVS